MGGTLKTDRVCRACNGRAGSEIDAPFMKDWLIAMQRELHSPGGHRLRPRVEAALEDGTPVDLQTGRGPWKATVRGSKQLKDDTVTIRASSRAEYDKLLGRVRRDVEAQGKTLPELDEPTEFETNGPVVVSAELDGVVWLRMAAKVTLACLSKVLPDSWLDSTDAIRYRGWLWDADPVNADGSPALALPVTPSELELQVLDPPEHLLYCAPLGDGRLGVGIAYFGSIVVRARVSVGDLPMPGAAWRTGPGAPANETSFDALLMEAALKFAEAADEPGT